MEMEHMFDPVIEGRPHVTFSRARRSTLLPPLLLILLLPLVGCGDAGGERIPLDGGMGAGGGVVEDLPAELQTRLDSANAAYRGRDYARALGLFEEVTRLAPELAAGWYGVGMTQGALGNRAAADSAMLRVHRLAPELPLQHPAATAPPNPHPAIPPGGVPPS
jgi:hypothetical protein